MSLSLLGYTPEECVDFEISIGLIPQNERQTTIDKLYKDASKVLDDMWYNTAKNIYEKIIPLNNRLIYPEHKFTRK